VKRAQDYLESLEAKLKLMNVANTAAAQVFYKALGSSDKFVSYFKGPLPISFRLASFIVLS